MKRETLDAIQAIPVGYISPSILADLIVEWQDDPKGREKLIRFALNALEQSVGKETAQAYIRRAELK